MHIKSSNLHDWYYSAPVVTKYGRIDDLTTTQNNRDSLKTLQLNTNNNNTVADDSLIGTEK